MQASMSADLDRTIQFWLRHSHDDQAGGYFNCLGKDGRRYDDLKYGWLQGRQAWMYARLYNEVERFRKPDILDAAVHGVQFILDNLKDPQSGRCYFIVTRDGKPIKTQRTIFTESFCMMALSEVARATQDEQYKSEAIAMMDRIIHWVRVDDTPLGIQRLAGHTPVNSLATPMILLSLVDQMETMDSALSDKYREHADWAVQQILAHRLRQNTWIAENVSVKGEELPGSAGRVSIPGHAIECGWFLLNRAIKTHNESLKKIAIEHFIDLPFSYGWDKTHGGLFYFLDADGLSPTQLEWDMKLWWPHNEAMIAFLMAYRETGREEHWQRFVQVYDYSCQHFVEMSSGEWFGYLNRQGDVSMDFKGGPFKGCFHVPRCLMMCEQMLADLKTETGS